VVFDQDEIPFLSLVIRERVDLVVALGTVADIARHPAQNPFA
jgi:hypothetical protein